ncbi:hypothetical protein X777_03955 [Ooceraea biroi]|uniref:Uncharacterized protein n=1 Tax=Ooceraea biroi TaxID=2015173 RepID=A0A026WIE0_OOCBI|nr:hypothetical protein X777_03955 [Ooceraea biroi]
MEPATFLPFFAPFGSFQGENGITDVSVSSWTDGTVVSTLPRLSEKEREICFLLLFFFFSTYVRKFISEETRAGAMFARAAHGSRVGNARFPKTPEPASPVGRRERDGRDEAKKGIKNERGKEVPPDVAGASPAKRDANSKLRVAPSDRGTNTKSVVTVMACLLRPSFPSGGVARLRYSDPFFGAAPLPPFVLRATGPRSWRLSRRSRYSMLQGLQFARPR